MTKYGRLFSILKESSENPVFNVKNETYFWSSHKHMGTPEIGFQVPVFKHHEVMMDTEKVIEAVRQESFPDRPSRLKSIFFYVQNKKGFVTRLIRLVSLIFGR